ncbi:hypothetical protein FE257_000177 [Aspergillus nanangensis]|uniref:Uncharacterized protein n=1 Tax=Aspergillus nanangensis TaxID=2582783 RepID=A0AAD4GYV0_ASPNN|nr:hypothetical protein FE257_000177 [Aspergillus nanangensis]
MLSSAAQQPRPAKPAYAATSTATKANSRLACGYNWDCVFHASNTAYPALVGCCPVSLGSSSTTECKFLTTCYDSAQVAATSSLSALATDDPFVTLCTSDDNVYCHTWTWPDLSVADYGCTWTSAPSLETLQTMGSLTDVTVSEDMTTETLSMSWVDDSVVKAVLAGRATSASSSSSTSSMTSEATARGANAPHAGGSTPIGAIVGGSIGGVVAVLIVVGGVLYWWRTKRQQQQQLLQQPQMAQEGFHANSSSSGPSELHGQSGSGVLEMDASRLQEIAELDGQGRRHELG